MTTIDFSILMLFGMLFMHVIEDFHLQGILASMKQRDWWKNEVEKNGRDFEQSPYRYDYLVALFMHAFEWTACVLIVPVVMGMWRHMAVVLVLELIDTPIHAYVDHLKANRRQINLADDQCMHLVQIFCMWIVCVVSMKLL